MEKLLNLLQEFYWENRKFSNDDWFLTMTNWVENLSGAYAQTYIISLQGGFIQRLVEQDKIRDDGIKPRTDLVKEITIVDYDTGKAIWWKNKYSETEQLLMYLAISEQPIEFLISILKNV
jgi:hypothetical protein